MTDAQDLGVVWRGLTVRRLVLLYTGLTLGGIGFATFVIADLGLDPWDVFHQGMSRVSGLSIGSVVILASLAVLLLWIPLRQRPGLGTLSDVVVVGLVIDATLAIAPRPSALGTRVVLLLAAIIVNGVGTSMYIAAELGPGPRDGLMTGLARRGLPLRRARVTIDLSVLGVGWLLGGTVGVGTVASSLAIGPIVHVLLPRFRRGSYRRHAPVPGAMVPVSSDRQRVFSQRGGTL